MVQFFEGVLKSFKGNSAPIVWAESRSGNRVVIDSKIRGLEASEMAQIELKELITTVDLDGLDVDDVIYIIDAILKGKYYSRPGVKGKLDAALYLLVNEALSELSRPVED
ncbi:MAG: hypothetical protein ACLPVO_20515 [Desulfomonilaceae bacterium]